MRQARKRGDSEQHEWRPCPTALARSESAHRTHSTEPQPERVVKGTRASERARRVSSEGTRLCGALREPLRQEPPERGPVGLPMTVPPRATVRGRSSASVRARLAAIIIMLSRSRRSLRPSLARDGRIASRCAARCTPMGRRRRARSSTLRDRTEVPRASARRRGGAHTPPPAAPLACPPPLRRPSTEAALH